MKILHATEIAQAGVATALNALVPLQARASADDRVIVYVPADHAKNLTAEVHQTAQIETYRRGHRGVAALLRFAWGLIRLVRTQQPDIVHLHSTFAGALGRLCRPFFPRKTHVVYCAHGWAFYREDSTWQRWLYRRIEAALSYVGDAWIGVAYHERTAGLAAGLCPSRGTVVRYGLADLGEPAPREGRWSNDTINLLFVGRFDRQKGLDVLLQAYAMADAPHLHLYLAGANLLDAPDAQMQQAQRVTQLGWCNAEQLRQHYAECDAVIIPSRWEGLPLVGLETLRAGRAILGSTRCSVPELVQEGRNGHLFALESVEAIAALLLRLDKAMLQGYGLHSRTMYLEQFQATRMHDEMRALYLRIINGTPFTDVRTPSNT